MKELFDLLGALGRWVWEMPGGLFLSVLSGVLISVPVLVAIKKHLGINPGQKATAAWKPFLGPFVLLGAYVLAYQGGAYFFGGWIVGSGIVMVWVLWREHRYAREAARSNS